ncbi:MAG: hypothetical protein WCK70_16325 [Chloroflexales bacterium]
MAPRRSFTLAMPDSDPRSARIWQHLSRIGADADASAELRALICAALDQTARLDRIEDKLDQTTRLDRIEAKLDQTARLDRIEDKLDRLIDGGVVRHDLSPPPPPSPSPSDSLIDPAIIATMLDFG